MKKRKITQHIEGEGLESRFDCTAQAQFAPGIAPTIMAWNPATLP